MSIRTPRQHRRFIKGRSISAVQQLEERRMLCYADGGVIQHIGSRSHPSANAAQLLADAVVPVVQEAVVQPGKVDPNKPNPMGNQEALPGNLQFNSRPGAPVSLYLDFDGQGETTFADGFLGFGGYDVPAIPAYDIDGNAGSFNPTEVGNIERMWRVVAEKFSPLEINVTTVEPGSGVRQARVVVGGNGGWYGSGGGVAVEDGFFNDGFLWSADSTAYVWRAPTNPDSMAEGIAHEAGHLFGLKHNSDKDFYGNITTEYRPGWIMGEGYGAATPGRWDIDQTSSHKDSDGDIHNDGRQSDIATMINEAGLQLRADDHSNAYFFATPLGTTSSGRAGTGVHETEGDMDYFSFTTSGGFMSITVNPAQFQAMDNLTLEIVGLATINTAAQGESWTSQTTMAAGTYYIGVHSRGQIGDIGSYSIGVTLNEAFNNTIKTATPVGRFGELPGTFGLVNPIYAGRGVIADFVGNSDTEDYYRIQTDNVTTRQTVWLYNLSQDADVELIADRNRNFQTDGGEIIAFSNASGTTGEAFTVDLAPNSTYYIHVYRYLSANTNYSLELRADGAGEQPRNAGLPARGPNIFAGEGAFYDQVDEFELRDVYRIRPDYPGYLDLSLTGLGADADLRVAIDFNNNGVIEAGETQYQSSLGGSNSEFLNDIEVNPAWNAVGGYYVIVERYAGVTNYRLGVHLDTSTTSGANSLSHPWMRSLGDLSTNNYRSFDEYIGAQDAVDIFSFTAPAGLLSIRGSGTGHYRDLIRDLNNNGVVDSGEVVASGINMDYTVPGAVGTTQTLYLRVLRSGGEFPTDGNYHQSMASQVYLPTSDNSFGSARVLAMSTTAQRFAGYLQSDSFAPEYNDLDDYYTFSIDAAQRTRFSLGNVAARTSGDGEGVGVPLAGLQLVRDDNGNGVLDPNERLAGQGVYGARRSTLLETSLEPGTYFVRVFVERPERPDETGAARTNYTLDYQVVDDVVDDAPYVVSTGFGYETGPQSLAVAFSEDVSGTLSREDVVVTDSLGNVIPLGEMFYDASTNQAYFSFVTPSNPTGLLPQENYTVTIDGSQNLRDEAGIALASPFTDAFHVLPGDANRDRAVNFDDLLILAQNYGNAGTYSLGDFSYDGMVDFDDLLILAQQYGTSLATDWTRVIANPAPSIRGGAADDVLVEEMAPNRSSRRIADDVL
jgi:hypothetical protein